MHLYETLLINLLPSGQGGANPAAVADAMVDAVVDFVKKKQPKFVCSIKILIFQTAMTADFHRSMKKWEGQQVQEKGLLDRIKGVCVSCLHLQITIISNEDQRVFGNNMFCCLCRWSGIPF